MQVALHEGPARVATAMAGVVLLQLELCTVQVEELSPVYLPRSHPRALPQQPSACLPRQVLQ